MGKNDSQISAQIGKMTNNLDVIDSKTIERVKSHTKKSGNMTRTKHDKLDTTSIRKCVGDLEDDLEALKDLLN